MNDTGWVKNYRSMVKWGWYTDVPVKTLFTHLILVANWEPGEFLGREIQQGQTVTSVAKLSAETGLTVKQVRIAMEKLKKTGEITVEATNKYTVITVVNYCKYQSFDYNEGQTEDKQTANKGQTEGNQTANEGQTKGNNIRNKEYKKNKNLRNKEIYIQADEVIDHLNMRTGSQYRHSESSRKNIVARLNEGYTVQQCKDVIDKKCVEWMNTEMQKYLTTETLFRPSKFEKYLNQAVSIPKPQNNSNPFIEMEKENMNEQSGYAEDTGFDPFGIPVKQHS